MTFKYDGPIYKFGRLIKSVQLETEAVSVQKAVSNFLFQAKRSCGDAPYAGGYVIKTERIVKITWDTDVPVK